MPLQSDITVNLAKFDPKSISEKTANLTENLHGISENDVKWWEVGAPKYRQMRLNGETPIPKPVILPSGHDITLPSRDPARSIPCRLFTPTSSKPNGVIMHIHGGGWVLMSEKTSDPLLRLLSDTAGCAVISVGYRLAPEDPYPAGVEDCFDAAEFLVKNGEHDYGGGLKFMAGESAGAHLATLTAIHLLRTYHTVPCPSLILHFGSYDLSLLPQALNLTNPPVLDLPRIRHFTAAFLPGMTTDQKRDPNISPFYADLEPFRGRLPKALFTCGTADCLLDDTVFMGTKWLVHGGEAVVKIYPGACHGFIALRGVSDQADLALEDVIAFVKECL